MKKTILLFSLVAACLVSIGEPVKSMVGADMIEMNGDDYLPYDSRVEYIESTGTQWIDTEIVPQLLGVSKISIKPTVENDVPWGCKNFTEISSYARYFTDKGLGVRLVERLTPAMISKSTERQNNTSPMEPYQSYQIIFSKSQQAVIAGYLEEATLVCLDS